MVFFFLGNVIVVMCNFLMVIICLFILNRKGIDVWLMRFHLSSIGSCTNAGALSNIESFCSLRRHNLFLSPVSFLRLARIIFDIHCDISIT